MKRNKRRKRRYESSRSPEMTVPHFNYPVRIAEDGAVVGYDKDGGTSFMFFQKLHNPPGIFMVK
jgi:hypothetical protein